MNIHILTSDFDPGLIPPEHIERSAEECRHTSQPEEYNQWHEWAKHAHETHSQVKCPHCGLWAVWLPKDEARQINKEDLRGEREAVKAYNELWKSRN